MQTKKKETEIWFDKSENVSERGRLIQNIFIPLYAKALTH